MDKNLINKIIDITGIGVSTLDLLNLVDHFPQGEEVQKSIQSVIDGGGPVATALTTAAILGSKTVMLDSMGNDWIGINIREGLRKAGVDTSYIKVHHESTSSLASILVRKNDGARTIVYSPGNSPELTKEDIPEELIAQSKILHMNGRHFSACLHAVRIAKENNCKVSFDGGAHRYNDELTKLVPLSDILIASKHFIQQYTKTDDNLESIKILLGLGIETLVITDGINGSWLYTNEIHGYHQYAFINDSVVDTTGCGDSYHGAFLHAFSQGKEVKDAMRIASAVASLNTRKLGGRCALPSKEELEKFLAIN